MALFILTTRDSEMGEKTYTRRTPSKKYVIIHHCNVMGTSCSGRTDWEIIYLSLLSLLTNKGPQIVTQHSTQVLKRGKWKRIRKKKNPF